MSTTINPLALPKGVDFKCELCSKPARIVCSLCKLTYYCSVAHCDLDQESIHCLICDHLRQLREHTKTAVSESQRKEHASKVCSLRETVIEISTREAIQALHSQQFSKAISAALQTLNNSVVQYGPQTLQVVPSYMLLGEASIGLDQLSHGKEYLFLASWILYQHFHKAKPETDEGNSTIMTVNSLKSRLYLLFGKLYLKQESMSESRKFFSKSVYFSSLSFGLLGFASAIPLFYIGHCFDLENENENCIRIYSKVGEILKNFLEDVQSQGQLSVHEVVGDAQFIELETVLSLMQKFYEKQGDQEQDSVNYLMELLYY
ncbi:hypothetical protein GEMRC1_008558 [Eukaryota sp. GEM-RC1]